MLKEHRDSSLLGVGGCSLLETTDSYSDIYRITIGNCNRSNTGSIQSKYHSNINGTDSHAQISH